MKKLEADKLRKQIESAIEKMPDSVREQFVVELFLHLCGVIKSSWGKK